MDISVVIPTYNRYKVLKRALESVLAQSYPAKEIIVIDDGSNDDTSEIVKEFPGIKYHFQKNSGVSSARNRGIKASTSEWIAFLDSDDEWHKEKLKEHVDFHTQNTDTLISYTNERWIRNSVEVQLPKKYRKHGGYIFKECLSHCIIAPSATIIHRTLFDKVGLFDESLEVCEDYDLWLKIAAKNRIGLIDKKLITKYGGDPDQLSMKYWGMDRFRVKALEKLLSGSEFSDKHQLIIDTLIDKYDLLLKGAKKHNKVPEIEEYKRVKQMLCKHGI